MKTLLTTLALSFLTLGTAACDDEINRFQAGVAPSAPTGPAVGPAVPLPWQPHKADTDEVRQPKGPQMHPEHFSAPTYNPGQIQAHPPSEPCPGLFGPWSFSCRAPNGIK